MELEPPSADGFRWEYRLDVGRASFDDGIGDYFSIWRAAMAVAPSPKRRPRFP